MESLVDNVLVLVLLLLLLGKSASWAVRAAVKTARIAGLNELVISIVVITAISILPETIISIISAFRGSPSLGLGTLLGSNVVDLTFVLGVMAVFSRKKIAVESTFIKKDYLFLGFLLPPLILGFTGHFSRLDGIILILASLVFFYAMTQVKTPRPSITLPEERTPLAREAMILVLSLLAMGGSAYYVVKYAEAIATSIGVTPALIGLTVIAIGTCLPELIFSFRAISRRHPTLALGDVFGTVITDANLVLGITAFIHPFSFNPRLIIVTGIFMLLAGLFSLELLRSDRALTRSEGFLLLVFYGLFITVEFTLRNWTPLLPR